eukprot:TRINITY_DN10003_c0_g1_i1.p1 TRINITY_DN10003_c0_g1~~TRINITY_DN10003_c0_g1_i1.p1  ORF type:complete len:418 (+),score=38.94 TRINITY_DN10003_c0_g1_i1:31-1254(+)
MNFLLLLAPTCLFAYYSDWAPGACPATLPPNSISCTWMSLTSNGGATVTYEHRLSCTPAPCVNTTDTGCHYCGDECTELCDAAHGGGVVAHPCLGANNPCGSNGACQEEPLGGEPGTTSAHCYCTTGWAGTHCTVPSSSDTLCANKGCQNNAPCAVNGSTAVCMCEDKAGAFYLANGFEGQLCEKAIDKCKALQPDCGNGVCDPDPNGYHCICSKDWTGATCKTPAVTLAPWMQAILNKHNELRSDIYGNTPQRHQPGAAQISHLTWDQNIALNAQNWADQTDWCGSGLQHSPSSYRTGKYGYSYIGENLYAGDALRTTCGNPTQPPCASGTTGMAEAVQTWWDEYIGYDYENAKCTAGMCGHFTQVAWASTTAIGCGIAQPSSCAFGVYLVCESLTLNRSMGSPQL